MQESWGTYSDRVSRLGWEGASERPMAWRAPWRHLDLVVVLAALSLALLGIAAIYSSTFASLREQGLAEATFDKHHAGHPGAEAEQLAPGWPAWCLSHWSTTAATRRTRCWCSARSCSCSRRC